MNTGTKNTKNKISDLELKKLNEELEIQVREKTSELKNIFERVTDAFIALNCNWEFTYVNKIAGELFGRKPEEMIGKNVWEEFPDLVKEPIYDALHNAMNMQMPAQLQLYSIARDRWFEDFIYPSADGVSVYYHDITDKKKAEEKLAVSENRFRAIFEAEPECIKLLDKNLCLIEMNPAGLEMLEATSMQQVLGANVLQLVNRDCHEQFQNLNKKIFEGKSGTLEFSITNLKGKNLRMDTHAVPLFNQAGEIISAMYVTRDITEKKNAEEETKRISDQLSEVSSSIPGAVYQFKIDPNGKMSFEYVSEGIRELCGLNPEEIYQDAMVAFSLTIKDDLPGLFSSIEESHHTLQPWFHVFRIIDLHEQHKWIRGNSIPKKLDNGDTVWNGTLIDVTDLKKAEAELKTSELRYRSLVEQATDGIFLAEHDGSLIDVNTMGCRMLGYKREEILGKNFTDFVLVKVNEPNLQLEKLRSGENILSARNARKKDGSFLPVEINSKMLVDGRLLGIVRDITERKRSEAILKESEFRVIKVIENEILGVAWASPDGRVTNMNEAFCKMIGYEKEELLNVHFSDFTHPLDAEKELKLIGEIFAGKRDNYRIEKRYKTKQGEFIWVELNLSCYRNSSDNSIEFFIGITQNINDRKKAEEIIRLSEKKYKLLFYENPLPMWMVSMDDLSFIDVNESSVKHYGYSREEFLSMTLKDIRPKEEIPHFMNHMRSPGDSTVYTGRWRHKKKDGTIIHAEVMAHNIIYEGKPVRLILSNDVTEKVLAEEQLKQSHEQLRQLSSHLQTVREEERTSIAREIHDVLGQQLTGLRMDISWLNKRISGENQIVQAKISGMLSLVDETMKTVRHISSELRPSILDDLGLIDALDWQSNEFEKRTGLQCSFETQFKERDFDKNLSTGIFRVFQETLTNVARHAQASEVKTSLEMDDNSIILRIKDNGKGFDESEIKTKNTLGLVGMRERAMMFGGKIFIESSKGEGTAVILKVPLKISTGKIF